jgi:molybdopterin/thiamine biosynthesis adenylyltransferase
MAGMLHHERIYRGSEALARLAALEVTLCGAGALGSQLADNLARQGIAQLRVIDRDRVEEHNAGTQLYGISDVGGWKVEILRQRLFRDTGIEIEAIQKELTERTVGKLLPKSGLVIDTFDNSAARQLVQDHCRAAQLACLHVGLFADYCEVIWDENYRVPRDVTGDVCDYPLARNLVLLAVSLASEVLVRDAITNERLNLSGTLGDFAVRPLEAGTG